MQTVNISEAVSFGPSNNLRPFFFDVVRLADSRLALDRVYPQGAGFRVECTYTPSNPLFGDRVTISFEIQKQVGMGTGYVLNATVGQLPEGVTMGEPHIPREIVRPDTLIVWNRVTKGWEHDRNLIHRFEPFTGPDLSNFGILLSETLRQQLAHLRAALLEANDIT